jgi:hypothetical protein
MFTIDSFRVNDRIELHPATDSWMRGDRYGIVERIGMVCIWVRLDSGRRIRLLPDNVYQVIDL